jgi:hypothetical protein
LAKISLPSRVHARKPTCNKRDKSRSKIAQFGVVYRCPAVHCITLATVKNQIACQDALKWAMISGVGSGVAFCRAWRLELDVHLCLIQTTTSKSLNS